jgi:hypothetical protein
MNNRTVKMIMTTIAVVCMLMTPQIAQAATDCSNTGSTGIPQTECQSLLDLYNSTNGVGWINNTGWNVTDTPCSWFGVSCSGGHVTTLNLNTNQLSGTIPNLNLPSLTSLQLYANQLSGSIPNFNLPNLVALSLYNNQLTGTIPDFNMPNLVTLFLHINQLSGTIPNFNLPNLTNLSVHTNQLNGSIPNFNLPSLTTLRLYANQLTGAIPNFNMPNLTSLYLNNNQLSGTIPNLNFSGFTALLLNKNCGLTAYDTAQAAVLTGKDPIWQQLNPVCPATSCNLVTEIPTTECQELLALYNSTNGPGWTDKTGWNINNTPCSWFGVTCSSGHVKTIGLTNNQLSGTIPNLALPNLTHLILSDNQLSGNIPNFDLPSLKVIGLTNNQLTGTIPNFNMPNLNYLTLPGNQLSGSIPNFNMPNLTHLSLYDNQLSGSLPNFNMMPNLIAIGLSANQLSGTIPNFNMPNLTYLALSANQLSGTIPNFNLPSLTELRLHINHLSGTIPNLNFSGFTALLLNKNCGLTAYDTAQATVLIGKDPIWQQLNPVCPNYTVNFVASPTVGGTVNLATQTVTIGQQTSSVTASPMSGYTFLYWKQGSNIIAPIDATLPPQTITADTTYTAYFAIQPSITAITPNSGSIAGGTPITITGTNFADGQTTVKFGVGTSGQVLALSSVTPTQITATTPSHSVAETVPVVVIVNGVSAYSVPPSGGFTYYYTYGASFSASPSVGGTVSMSYQNVAVGSQTSSVTATPTTGYTFINWKDQNGAVVSTSPTLSAQTITKDMTYTAFFGILPIISSISPATITPTAATPLTISGSGFSSGVQVWLSTGIGTPVLTAGLTQLSASPVSSAQITATVPANFLPGTYYVFVYDPVSTIWSAAANSTANVLTVNPSGLTYTWTGHETPAAPTDWLKAGNWTPFWNTTARVPTDNAIIPGTTASMPVLASSATLNSLTIAGSLDINSGGTLNANAVFVNGNLTDNGMIIIPASAKLIISPSGVLKLTGGSIQIDPSNIPPNSGLVNQGKIEWSKGVIYGMTVSPQAFCSFVNEKDITVAGTGPSYISNCDVTNGPNGLLEVIINNTLTIYEKDFTNLGTVRGGGTIYFDPYPSTTPQMFINKGLVNPKIPSGIHGPLNIKGNFNQDATGTLQLDVSSTGYDYLNVDGSVSLDGTIALPSPLPIGTFDVVRATGAITVAGTLKLPPAPTGYTVSGSVVPGTPNVYRIAIRRSGYTWGGTNSDTWTEAGNWVEGAVPTLPTDSAVIPAGCPNYPHINSDVHIGGITIEQDASLTVHTGFKFNIHGDSTNNGTVNLLGGNLLLDNNAVFTNIGSLIFFTPSGATSKLADAPGSQGKLINVGMIINQSFSGILDVFNFEQIPTDSAKGISILSGDLRLASGNTQNTYTIGASAFSGDGTLIFGSDNPDTNPMIIVKDNLNMGVPLRWVSGVVEPEAGVTTQLTMTISKNAEIGSAVFKKLYGMDISIQSGSIVTLKDGEFYLGNRANFKNDGGILSIEGKMSFYNYDADAALTGTVVNNGTVRGTGILSFAPNTSDPKSAVAFSNNGILSPGLSPGLLTFDMGSSVYDHSNGTLNIEINSSIAGSGYDRLNVIGNVKLGGTLNVVADSAYVPHDGDIFDILTLINTGSLTGQFASVNLPNISGFHWEPVSYASPVRLTLRQNTSAILTVAVDPADSGAVSGGGITCPAVCSKTVDSTVASSITLSASANSGYVFDHWELNNATAGTEPASMIVNFPANSMMTQAVKAVFKAIQKNRITLSVSPSASGWVSGGGFSCSGGCASGTTCSDVCQQDFDPAVTPSITLSASANTGYEFDYWKVNDLVQTPSSSSLTVSTNSPSTIIAVFKPKTISSYTLSVSVSPSGAGKVSVYQSGSAISECPTNCTVTVASGTKVSLYPTPGSGHHFFYWSGAASGSSVSVEITMDSNKSVTAYFEADTPSYPSYETPTDYCPDDPLKTEPGKCGCGVADTDSDGDGVPDCLDKCPNDPNKIEPGKCGCGKPDTENCGGCPAGSLKAEPGICGCDTADTDSDRDGVADCLDRCSSDPNKTEPGICGCGVSDTDTDKDGVADCLDRCPDDPNKTEPGKCGCGVVETENCGGGCPAGSLKAEPGICGCNTADTDSDGDGVADCFDKCPNDPNKAESGICGCGVPDIDSKGDGITDCLRGDPPKPPVLLSPKLQEIIAYGPVKLKASPFSAPENQTHIATHWLIQRADRLYRSAKSALFDDHKMTSGDLTGFEFSDVSPGLKYICKAGYRSSGNTQISWSDESSFIVGTPEQSPILEIPAGETAEQYRMFSFPYWLQNEDAVAALNAVIGSYDPKMVRIGAYDANTGGYVEYGEGMKIIPGKAYWILARNGVKLTLTGVPVSLNHTMEVILDNGWNMIAAPNNTDYDWSKIEVLVYDDNLKVIYGPTAVSASDSQNYIDILWQWQNGDYASANTLEKNKGYWIKAKQSGVVLRFPETARGKSATRSEKRSNSEKPPLPMDGIVFDVISGAAEAAGGCFINSAAQK